MEDIKRNWIEDLTHENGNYLCICTVCKEQFQGHKRRVVCKLCATHPSDSDIESLAKFMHDEYERIAIEIGWDTQASCKVEFENLPKENKELMLLVAKSLRDRMNGEMCEYKELVFRLAEWSKKYPRGRIYGASRQESMDGELIEMEEAAKTILQKFRNRDI